MTNSLAMKCFRHKLGIADVPKGTIDPAAEKRMSVHDWSKSWEVNLLKNECCGNELGGDVALVFCLSATTVPREN